MFMRVVRKISALAAATVLAWVDVGGASAPASAQAPTISTISCTVYFKDLQINTPRVMRCGAAEVWVKRQLIVSCSGFGNCWANVTDYMQARQISYPDGSVLAVNAFSVSPNTCRAPLTSTLSPWCTVGSATNSDYAQAVTVVAR